MRRTATAALVGALLLAGCGGGDDDDGGKAADRTTDVRTAKTPAELIGAASAQTVKGETSKFSMHFAFDLSGLPGAPETPFEFDATGESDYRTGNTRMTADLSSIAASVAGAPKAMEMRLVDKIVYLKSAGLGIEGAKEWVKVDPATAGGAFAGLGNLNLDQLQSTDPRKALDYLKAASKEVTEVGTDTVRGTETTHLRATLDTEKLAGELPEQFRGAAAALNGGGGLPMDVWIDGDGRLRKLSMKLDMSSLLQGLVGSTPTSEGAAPPKAKAVMAMTFELFDFGTEVDVVAPPASQVSEESTLR